MSWWLPVTHHESTLPLLKSACSCPSLIRCSSASTWAACPDAAWRPMAMSLLLGLRRRFFMVWWGWQQDGNLSNPNILCPAKETSTQVLQSMQPAWTWEERKRSELKSLIKPSNDEVGHEGPDIFSLGAPATADWWFHPIPKVHLSLVRRCCYCSYSYFTTTAATNIK